MRKAQKQQVLDMLSQMNEAHEQIRKYIGQGTIPRAMELLTDCQNGAISIGTLIEKTEGEGHQTVFLLESYCEIIYQIYQKLEENNKEINAHKFEKQLRQKLLEVISSVKNDITIKTEAVFLPYKASMWDSLESVWKAADADPNCDAYVIPIPYYDRNPDGSFREMHYEGDQYPDYVPVTWYENYDFEVRKPDVIFIHNPYDESNLVTSVHPSFYSDKLKEYTEKLVYIPYFILGEIEPDNKEAVDGMKHFCIVPGVINADKVIVQSEDMRQVYIKVLTEAFGKESREYWAQKILGLGSPKVDKVLNTRKEDLEIPEEWLRVIQKPDGSWKKIIFYNTSVGALLQHNEKMLEKMQDVFRVFRENRDKIALLWRPHPLIKATIESMRPLLWAEYEEIVEKYKKEGWGIYDDTADMNRAVCLSDAYYGDESSLVQLFQKTGKKVLIQYVNTKRVQKTCLSCDCIITKEKICWYDMNSIRLQNRSHEEEKGYIWLYTGEYIAACEVGEKIFFAPMAESKIRILDLHIFQMSEIELFRDENVRIFNKFLHAKRCGNSIYFLPGKYPFILEYSLENRQMQRYSLDLDKINAHLNETLLFYESSYIYDDRIYLASANNGVICSFDTKTKKRNYFHVAVNDGFTTICGFLNKLYLADLKGNISKVIIGNDKMQSQKILGNVDIRFRKSIGWNDKIVMFIEANGECVIINPNNDDCEIITLFQSNTEEYDGNEYGEPKLLSDKLYIYNKIRKKILIIDKNMAVEEYEVSDITRTNYEIVADYGTELAIVENNAIEIDSLAYYLIKIQGSSRQENVAKDKETVGIKIEKAIKD